MAKAVQQDNDLLGPNRRQEARKLLDAAVLTFQGQPVGTVAATDPEAAATNYDQVFVRDFVPVALFYLAEGESAIVRHFLEHTCRLQAKEASLYCYQPGAGLIPASFKVATDGQSLVPDYGGHAIGRVASVDSSLWWLYLLCVYARATGDWGLPQHPAFQRAIQRILDLCLTGRFDMYPTLLVPDGSFMVDRRLGVYGYPLEIQALFYMALRAADELLTQEGDGPGYREAVRDRLGKLVYFVRTYYWLDLATLNRMYRARTEEYGLKAMNAFNIVPDSLPQWLFPWLPETGGYLAGNLGPSRMDFRFFTQGNFLALLSGLADSGQGQRILDLIEARANDLLAAMPVKLCFPALEGQDWRTVTGCDPKNGPWSYHNGGSWPVLLWLLAAAGARMERPEVARRGLQRAAPRLAETGWPEYFDGTDGRLIGKQTRFYQTWTLAGTLLAERLLTSEAPLATVTFEDDVAPETCPI